MKYSRPMLSRLCWFALSVVLVSALPSRGQEIVTPYGTTGTPLDGASSAVNGVVASSVGGTKTGARAAAPRPFRAARLTYLQGSVQVEQANATTNSMAVINMPLVEGTVVSTGGDGQAEIEFEDGSMARLTPNSGVSLLNLSADSSGIFHTRIALLGGLAYFELRAGTNYQYSVDAGGDAISPIENATVRVNFDQPPAVIAVLDGSVHVASATGSGGVEANAGQTVRSDNSGGETAGGLYMTKPVIAPESWDRWNEDRDAAAEQEAGSATDARSRFAGNQGYGWSDLDANGSWYDVPGRGEVWQPDLAANGQAGDQAGDQGADQGADQGGDTGGDQAAADSGQANAVQAAFDPYGYGSWVWTPAGYSWASAYAWGWLPYRCGQWSWFDDFGWGWTPSPVCGLFGFGGYGYGGYGYGVNLGPGPGGYRRPHRPIPAPGPIHPVLRGPGTGPVPVPPVHRIGQERLIAGVRVQPLQPLGSGFGAGGGGLGSALRRDYPIDMRTHTAVVGVVATTHGDAGTGANLRAAWQPLGGTAIRRPYGAVAQRPYYTSPRYPSQRQEVRPPEGQYAPGGNAGRNPGPGVGRPGEMPRPSAPSAPRPSPPPAPASHSAPPAPSPKGK